MELIQPAQPNTPVIPINAADRVPYTFTVTGPDGNPMVINGMQGVTDTLQSSVIPNPNRPITFEVAPPEYFENPIEQTAVAAEINACDPSLIEDERQFFQNNNIYFALGSDNTDYFSGGMNSLCNKLNPYDENGKFWFRKYLDGSFVGKVKVKSDAIPPKRFFRYEPSTNQTTIINFEPTAISSESELDISVAKLNGDLRTDIGTAELLLTNTGQIIIPGQERNFYENSLPSLIAERTQENPQEFSTLLTDYINTETTSAEPLIPDAKVNQLPILIKRNADGSETLKKINTLNSNPYVEILQVNIINDRYEESQIPVNATEILSTSLAAHNISMLNTKFMFMGDSIEFPEQSLIHKTNYLENLTNYDFASLFDPDTLLPKAMLLDSATLNNVGMGYVYKLPSAIELLNMPLIFEKNGYFVKPLPLGGNYYLLQSIKAFNNAPTIMATPIDESKLNPELVIQKEDRPQAEIDALSCGDFPLLKFIGICDAINYSQRVPNTLETNIIIVDGIVWGAIKDRYNMELYGLNNEASLGTGVYNHGTHVAAHLLNSLKAAGMTTAQINNEFNLINIAVLDSWNSGNRRTLKNGLEFISNKLVVERPDQETIVNLSIGYSAIEMFSTTNISSLAQAAHEIKSINETILKLAQQGANIYIATGNSYGSSIQPCSSLGGLHPQITCVSRAVKARNNSGIFEADQSNFYTLPEQDYPHLRVLVQPGISTYFSSYEMTGGFSGTSMAAPTVAGGDILTKQYLGLDTQQTSESVNINMISGKKQKFTAFYIALNEIAKQIFLPSIHKQ